MKVQFTFPLAVVVAIASTLGTLSWAFLSVPGMLQQQAATAEKYPAQDNTSTADSTSHHGTTYAERDNTSTADSSSNSGTTKTFYLFNAELDQVNESKLGFSGDIYSLQTIVVNKGDKVNINFFNTESDKNEKHSFTLPEYNINQILNGGDHATISFVADKAGIFQYHCNFHPPEMIGQLIVLQGNGGK
jgi:nitrous oxide reductase